MANILSGDGYPVRNVYIDESSQTKAKHLVLGGLTIPAHLVGSFAAALQQNRLPELPAGEMKWTKVSPAKLAAYKRFTGTFFEPEWRGQVQFHSLIVDTHRQDHKAFNQGSREIGFNKEIYQIIQKFRRLYGDCVFHVYPDSRETPQSTDELRTIVNLGARKAGDRRPWPVRRLHFANSKQSLTLQLVDLFTGALAFRVNDRHLAVGASVAKIELSQQVLDLSQIRDPKRDTSARGKFTVWHRQLK
ncbi:DUF3800 domain-containing protein [Minwuia sp.]|uniref:DUF3800 domain-containing protein n=1 Tax=Minwuia sp. TaxID=2493630 RepID=UPI003A94E8AC